MGKNREQIAEYRKQLSEHFLNVLEEKPLTWKKDWKSTEVPKNGVSGHIYKGINRLNLTLIAMERGYEDPRWATYYQIQKKGWKLNNAKGQGVNVEYWFPYDRENKKYLTWEEFRATKEDFGKQYLLLATYKTVFNGDLIEGIPERKKEEREPVEVSELVNKIQKNMGVEIMNDGGDQAYYDGLTDKIHLPRPEAFQTSYGYNSTAFHELTHATGAAHRLNRDLSHGYGSPEYAFEELVAEISSCFFSANLDLELDEFHIQNHRAYVQGWAKSIKDRPETLVEAVQQAEKAAGYLEHQAELIKETDYQKIFGSSLTIKNQDLERTDKRIEIEQVQKSLDKRMERSVQRESETVKTDEVLYSDRQLSLLEQCMKKTAERVPQRVFDKVRER